MRTREHYEKLFEAYPDVVTLPEFAKMLGGIGDSTARKLMRGNHVQHFCIRHTYLIPKTSVIEYVLSEHYAKYKSALESSSLIFAHLRCSSPSTYNEITKEEGPMKKRKFKIYLTPAENSIVIQSLNHLRNTMLRENRDTDCLDELLLKAMCAPVKKM